MLSRQRDLLPCPLPFPDAVAGLARNSTHISGWGDAAPPSLTRSVRRRLRKRLAWQQWANDGVRTLNSLYARDTVAGSSLSAGQLTCLQEIRDVYQSVGGPDDIDAAGAFKELCGSRPGYGDDLGHVGKPSPFVAGKVSLPPVGSQPAQLKDVLTGRALQQWTE